MRCAYCTLPNWLHRNTVLQRQREPQHIPVLDAVFDQRLGIVGQEVILHDGIDAKAVALIIGELMAKAAGANLDMAYPLLGKALQHKAQQVRTYASLLVFGGYGDIEDLDDLFPDTVGYTGSHNFIIFAGAKAQCVWQIGGYALF